MATIVERYLAWAKGASVGRRREAASALARSFLFSPLILEERDQVEAAMTVLLDDPALEVRLALAEILAASEQAPHHLILGLAADKDAVAALVAEKSPLLLDSELVDMLAERDGPVQAAIARRPFVSRALSAAVAEVAGAAACEALITNPGARVLRFSLDRMVARHGDCPELRTALLQRPDLPLETRQVLLASLAGALCDLVVHHSWLSSERAAALTQDAREWATIHAAFEAPAESVPALVRELMQEQALTPSFLIRAVASGQTAIFEAALAALAKVPQTRVSSLIASGRAANLQALLDVSTLPRRTFPAFAAAIDVIRTGDSLTGASSDYRRATQLIDAIVMRYQGKPDRELDGILALLRRFAADAKRSAARDYAHQMRDAA